MSGGQRQCVAIARTAAFASKLVIMDEPTAALGVQETAQVENIIRGLKERGIPMVLVSHNLRQVFDLVDRIVVFRRGRIVASLRRDETDGNDIGTIMTLRFGLLGAGRIGKVHAKAVTANPKAKLVAVADAMAPAAQAIADQYGCDVRTIAQILAASDIDAVVICTPTDTHADLIEQFTNAGKAVFCEKPIDLSVKRVEECLKVVEANKTPLMVGFNRRFDPHFMAVRAAVEAGEIGTVEMVTIISRDPGAPPVEYVKRSG
eukprot:gene53441-71441_t